MIYQETQICDICYYVHETSVEIVHSFDHKEINNNKVNVGFNMYIIGHSFDQIQLGGKHIFKRLPKNL